MNQSKVFLFDGNCDFCQNLVKTLETKLKPKTTVFRSFRNITESEMKDLLPTLTLEICESDPQLIWNKKRYPGFFAIRQLLFDCPRGYLFIPFLYIPFVPLIGMAVLYFLRRFKT